MAAPKKLKSDVPSRGVTDVGNGDYVKISGRWKKISSNSAAGADRLPRHWEVQTEDGARYGMFNIQRYAKAEDLE